MARLIFSTSILLNVGWIMTILLAGITRFPADSLYFFSDSRLMQLDIRTRAAFPRLPDAPPITSMDATAGRLTLAIRGNVYWVDDDNSLQHVAVDNWFNTLPTLSPDGSLVAYFSERAGGIGLFIRDLAAQETRFSTRLILRTATYTWSPDGAYVAYITDGPNSTFIDVLDTATMESRHLTPRRSAPTLPSWSPDGEWIVYVIANRDTYPTGIYRLPALRIDSEPLRLSNRVPSEPPIWLADNQRLIFVSEWEIFLLDGDSIHNLTTHPARDFRAALSPDGEHLAFLSDRDGRLAVHLMHIETGHVRRLTWADNLPPVWGAP